MGLRLRAALRWLVPLSGLLAFLALTLRVVSAGDAECAHTGVGNGVYQPYVAEMQSAFGQAGTNSLGSSYPSLPQIEKGASNTTLINATIPKILLYAIGYVESSWHQAVYSVTNGAYGAPLVSGDCGYGIMQITSGMTSPGALDPTIQYNIASDYRYNIGWGAKMLVEKWNVAYYYKDETIQFPYVGDRNPCIDEDWYYAVWAYNDSSFKNHPANPDYPWPRPEYDWTQGYSRANYPYQELVWGFAAHPATNTGTVSGTQLWSAVPLTLPDRGLFLDGNGGVLQPWPNFPTPSPSHPSDSCQSLQVSKSALYFLAEPGKNPSPQSFQISGTQSGSYSWTVGDDQAWLSLSPASGGSVPATVTASANASGLGNGSYSGTITVTMPGADGSPKTIPVTLFVGPLQYSYLPIVMKGYSGGW